VNQRQTTEVFAVVQRFHDAFGVRFHTDRTLHNHVPRFAVVSLTEHCDRTHKTPRELLRLCLAGIEPLEVCRRYSHIVYCVLAIRCVRRVYG